MTFHQPLVADRTLEAATCAPSAPQRDNLLGVCHAIGTAFGVNPLWLRVAFAGAMLANFEAAVVAYLAGALVVALARR